MIKLILGDCLEKMKEIEKGSVDMILTDPPYGTTACKWDSIIPLDLMWLQLKRVIKPNGAIVMTASQPFTSVLISSNIDQFKYEWIWEKNKATGHLNAKKIPMKAHEQVLIFYNKPPTYNPQMTDGHKPMNSYTQSGNGECYGQTNKPSGGGSTLRYPRSVQQFPVINNDDPEKTHPTQKPVALMEYLIKTYTNEGETVLDFTMGSGTTGVACQNLNRSFIGIEKDEKYFQIASERMGQINFF